MSQTFTKNSVSAELALRMVQLASDKATELGAPSVIAIVDESGVAKLVARMDGAGVASIQVATDKAYSAAVTGVPTDQWYGISQQDPAFGFGLSGIDRLCPIGGGVPIQVDGSGVGGVGVSGGSPDQDVEVATAALTAVSA